MSTSFNQIRSQIITVENHLSTHLTTYSSFATSTSASATADELKAERSVETQLQSLADLVKELNKIVDSQSLKNSISTSKLQQLSRHKENLNQYRLDFNRIKSSIQQERTRLNLLSYVRTDIEENQRRATENSTGVAGNEDDYMLNERLRINSQHNVMDTLINQVYETRDEILRQRNTLGNMGNKLQRSLGTVPGLNVLLSKINTRKKRDSLILSGLIVLCVVGLWFLH